MTSTIGRRRLGTAFPACLRGQDLNCDLPVMRPRSRDPYWHFAAGASGFSTQPSLTLSRSCPEPPPLWRYRLRSASPHRPVVLLDDVVAIEEGPGAVARHLHHHRLRNSAPARW